MRKRKSAFPQILISPLSQIFFNVLLFLVTLCFCFLIFANICQDNIIIMATQFGERIRELRTKQNMLLRQLASLLDVDTSIISKVERGDRQLKKEQIPLLAQILKADVEELQTLWLADQIYAVVKDEKFANEAMQVADKKLTLKNASNKTNNKKVIA
jgi:transcriptional regulator with XRE-family HTH domain